MTIKRKATPLVQVGPLSETASNTQASSTTKPLKTPVNKQFKAKTDLDIDLLKALRSSIGFNLITLTDNREEPK